MPTYPFTTAREAFDKGLKRYYTGKPCRNGHMAERMVSNGVCVDCLKMRRMATKEEAYARTKAWRRANPGARTEEARRYREKHADEVRSRTNAWRAANIDKVREQNRDSKRRMRVINPDAERARIARFAAKSEAERTAQAGRPRPETCDICHDAAQGRIVFDHCHSRGHFRGWLCDRCNKILGLVKDSDVLLRCMANYLENDRGRTDDESA